MSGKIRIIPVLDLMNGLVVHAVEGKREEYKPIEESVISPSPNPKLIIQGLYRYGFRDVYIADLDAIIGRGENTWVLSYAVEQSFRVMADIGRKGVERVDLQNIRYVVGTEYIEYPQEIRRLCGRIASLDCYGLRTRFLNTYVDALQAVKLLTEIGVAELIVLDLTRVGSMKGPNLQLIDTVRRVYGGRMYVGGGVRGRNDIEELRKFSVDGVLIATAIHEGLVLEPYL